MIEQSVLDSLMRASQLLADATTREERDLILILIADALEEIANAQSCLLTGEV